MFLTRRSCTQIKKEELYFQQKNECGAYTLTDGTSLLAVLIGLFNASFFKPAVKHMSHMADNLNGESQDILQI